MRRGLTGATGAQGLQGPVGPQGIRRGGGRDGSDWAAGTGGGELSGELCFDDELWVA